MGGRGNTSSSGGGIALQAIASTSPINTLNEQSQSLSDLFDRLTPDQRQSLTGFTEDQLRAVGLNPKTAFLLTVQGLGETQIEQMLAQASEQFDGYVVINENTRGITGEYPFLAHTHRRWNIVMRTIDPVLADTKTKIDDFLPTVDDAITFGMSKPTLRWIKDGKVVDVYVDGMSLEDYAAAEGLEITMPKGEAVLGKRLSRIFRNYKLSDTFPSEALNIQVLEQSDHDKLVWDGAGVMSRKMLQNLAIAQEITGPALDELLDEVDHGGRVEFTILNDQGQYKGHAIVAENLTADFLLPDDVKSDVKLTTGNTFVGINFVHGKSSMALDVQSMVNLNPFFNTSNLSNFLEAEGDLYLQSLDTGHMTEVLQRIQPDATADDLQRWPLMEYYARGGDPTWFKTPISSTINQHLDPLEYNAKGKLRMPIPGERYYIMPDAVGRAAGRNVNVAPGEIFIDRSTNTAYVNAEDWVAMGDSPTAAGIRDILGGADNDDALWLHPFADSKDNANKVLVWRSPNEPGDYVVLKPTANSSISAFDTPSGPVTFRSADSNNLPQRRDRVNRTYLGTVPETDGSNLAKGQPYNIDIMDLAVRQEAINGPVLGMYVNNLMVQKLVFGKTPDTLPAPLETIVDASAKTGADLSGVKQWIFDEGAKFGEFGVAIPDSFQRRVARDRNDKETPKPKTTTNHWVDQLLNVVDTHIETTKQRANELRSNAQAPAALFDSAFENPEDIYLGASYNQHYGAAVKKYETAYGSGPQAHDAAQLVAEDFLGRFPEEKQKAILRGALVSGQMSERNASDAANWLQGHPAPQGRQRDSIAHKTIEALADIGLLGTITDTIRSDDLGRDRVQANVTRPTNVNQEPITLMTLEDATRFEVERSGQSSKTAPKSAHLAAQKRIEANTRAHAYDNQELTVKHQYVNGESRAVVYSLTSGAPLGLLPLKHPDVPEGSRVRVKHALLQGNNLRIIVQ